MLFSNLILTFTVYTVGAGKKKAFFYDLFFEEAIV